MLKRTFWLRMAAVFVLGGGPLRAADAPAPARGRPVLAQATSPQATLFERTQMGQPWHAVPAKGPVHAENLIFGLPGAALETRNGAVRLALLTDMARNSPYPIFEAAVRLHESTGFDLDFTLDRGRVDVTNIKPKGSARVRIRFHDQKWEATLSEPGTRIALELYGRWPRGVPFTVKPGAADVPAADLLFLVRKGDVVLRHGGSQHAMAGPPGPALLHWDNGGGGEEAPQKLEELPEWASPEAANTERAQRIKKVVEEFRREVQKSSLQEALKTFAHSDDANHRASGMIFMGATDELEGLADVLTTSKYPDTWDRAVVVLRHWLGRGPGQDQALYHGLIEKRHFTPAYAATLLQLLHSFGDADLAQPELYRMLVKYLDHEKMGVRGLAHWHLTRLVPAGKTIEYHPMDPKEKRDKARDRWKKLVEDLLSRGQLPVKHTVK